MYSEFTKNGFHGTDNRSVITMDVTHWDDDTSVDNFAVITTVTGCNIMIKRVFFFFRFLLDFVIFAVNIYINKREVKRYRYGL